jgi:hypothetical protein
MVVTKISKSSQLKFHIFVVVLKTKTKTMITLRFMKYLKYINLEKFNKNIEFFSKAECFHPNNNLIEPT